MTTIINTPRSGDDGGGVAMIFGIIVILALGALFYVYALPQLREQTPENTTTEIKVELPTPSQAPAPQADATTGQ
jgi:hypothetical protein